MIIRVIKDGKKYEEAVKDGMICGVRYRNLNCFNMGLDEFRDADHSTRKNIKIDENADLQLIIDYTPLMCEMYKTYERFCGMKILEFQADGVIVEIDC